MELKTYQDINQCRKLWERFSPNNKLFDSWDFRLCFYNRQHEEPNFLVARERRDIVSVMPLGFSKRLNKYTYFGGWFPERNTFFASNKGSFNQILEYCPDNTIVEGIDPEENQHYDLSEDEYTYYVDLSKYSNSFDNYFNSFDKKKRKDFRRNLRNIPKYKVYLNRLRDFNRLVELNIRQFDDESMYNDKWLKNSIRKMIELAQKNGILQMISVEINGKVEGIDVGILFGQWYHVVTGSSNNQKIPNLGKLMTVLSIKNAIAKKSRYVDFLASSGYWKDRWNFDKAMLLKFVK